MFRRDPDPEDHSLPPCARRMLCEGVSANQRVACFRLAVQLRKAGNPYDRTVAILRDWAQRNHPADGKGIIRDSEIRSQTRWAYRGGYKACGCEDPAVMPFCDSSCPLYARVHTRSGHRPFSLHGSHARFAALRAAANDVHG